MRNKREMRVCCVIRWRQSLRLTGIGDRHANWWEDTVRKCWKSSRKKLSWCHFCNHKFHTDWPVIELELREQIDYCHSFCLRQSAQTVAGVHKTFYSMGKGGSFADGKTAGGVLRSGMSGIKYPLPQGPSQPLGELYLTRSYINRTEGCELDSLSQSRVQQ